MTKPHAYVRVTEPAFDDLRALNRLDPQIVRWALRKMLLLERDPMAGAALGGSLQGFRKLVVGNRDWRIIWRVSSDTSGVVIIDIAEVWAVGARSNAEVYEEMRTRLARSAQPAALTLTEVVGKLAKESWNIEPANQPDPAEPRGSLPPWLVDKLTTVAGLEPDRVAEMSLEQAFEAWTEWVSQSR